MNASHQVSQPGTYIAIVSTTVENEADPISELNPGIALLGTIMERFDSVCPLYEPVGDGSDDKMFLTKSYDATSHFETVADDVLSLYERIMGEPLDMDNVPEED